MGTGRGEVFLPNREKIFFSSAHIPPGPTPTSFPTFIRRTLPRSKKAAA